MADARLQQLRRAWDEGDLEAQVRLLRERMRAGELTEERARLAAYLGDERARLIFTEGVALAPRSLERAVRGLPDFPKTDGEAFARSQAAGEDSVPFFWQVAARLGIAAARLIVPRSSGHDPITRAEDWVLCPCGEHRKAAGRATTLTAGEFATTPRAQQIVAHAADLARQPRCGDVLWECMKQAGKEVGKPAIRQAMAAELVPWALGLRDPVAERVAARKAGSE